MCQGVLGDFNSRHHAHNLLKQGWHHDHMMCIQCGKITEFVDQLIEDRQESIAKEHGFKIFSHSMTMYVDCQNEQCPSKKTRSSASLARK